MTGGASASRASGPVGGIAAVVVAATVWGTTGTATHFAPGVPAFVFGAVTFGVGGLVLAAVAGRTALRAVAGRGTRGWVLLGAGALVVYAVAFYGALADAGVALGTTIAIGSSPVFAGLVEWAADGRRVTRRWVVATLVSVVGMVVVTLARAGGAGVGEGSVGAPAVRSSTDGALAVGSLAAGIGSALLAGLTYAVYSWAVARGLHAAVAASGSVPEAETGSEPGRLAGRLLGPASARAGAVVPGGPVPELAERAAPGGRGLVGAVFGLAAVPLVVLAVVGGHDSIAVAAHWPVFAYLALVPTVIGHSLYAVGLRSVSPSAATLLSLFEPVVAAVLAVLVVGERLGAIGWVGIALVVVGLAVLAVPARTMRST